MKIHRGQNLASMPWKNGLGTTRQIAIFPPTASLAENDFQWRLSISEVKADGPFSIFPQCDRWLVVWKGLGLFLNERLVDFMKPVQFSGELPTSARLRGQPVMDLGLIFKRDDVEAEMRTFEFVTDSSAHAFDLKAGTHFLFCAQGEIEVRLGADSKAEPLTAEDTAEIGGNPRIHIAARAAEVSPLAVLVSLFPR